MLRQIIGDMCPHLRDLPVFPEKERGFRRNDRSVPEQDVVREDFLRHVAQGARPGTAPAEMRRGAAPGAICLLASVVPLHIGEDGAAGEDEARDFPRLVSPEADDDGDGLVPCVPRPLRLGEARDGAAHAVAPREFLTGRDEPQEAVFHVVDLRDMRLREEVCRGETADAHAAAHPGVLQVAVPFDEPHAAAVDIGVALVNVVVRLEREFVPHLGAQALNAGGVAVVPEAVPLRLHLGRGNIGGDLAFHDLVGDVPHRRGALGTAVDFVAPLVLLIVTAEGVRHLREMILRSLIEFGEEAKAVCLFAYDHWLSFPGQGGGRAVATAQVFPLLLPRPFVVLEQIR